MTLMRMLQKNSGERRCQRDLDVSIIGELGAALVHVDADDGAVRIKVLAEQLDGAALLHANLLRRETDESMTMLRRK